MNANETMNQPQSVSFTSRKLKKSASCVLASFRPSDEAQAEYALGPSLAAALLDELFEHPAGARRAVIA